MAAAAAAGVAGTAGFAAGAGVCAAKDPAPSSADNAITSRKLIELTPLVADPATLGRVRPLLHKEATQRIVAEIGKDLTNSRLDDIERLVARDA